MSDQNTPPPSLLNGPDRPKRKAPGRVLKVALAFSLALNLLILGLVGGAVWGAGRDRGDGAPGLRALGLGPFAFALSREDRREMRGRLDGHALGEDRRAIGQSLRILEAALRSDPFDRDAAEAAMQRSRMAAEALQAHGHGALLEQLDSLSADERIALADRLDRVLRRFGGRGDGHRP